MVKYNVNDFLALQPHFDRVLHKKQLLDEARPLTLYSLQKVKEQLFMEWTYNSNAMEGNTITLNETKLVLQDGMTVRGKSLREHFEVTNHHDAIAYLEQLVAPSYTLRERDILDIHQMVMQRNDREFAGRIRNAGVRITGANFVPPNALCVPDFLNELIGWTNTNPDELNALWLATVFHHHMVWIHPFFDGNGRTVRLVMNLLLMREGFPPAIILKNDRKKYYEALNQANGGQYSKLALLMLQALERSLDIYLSAVPGREDGYLPISQIVEEEKIPYGQEYVSLLARQGKIDAYKEGRNWYTTTAALREYVKGRRRRRATK
ncbi:MAG: Fic family protein [Chitinophagales bacterium]|nr:Fic family protein [Chitinophagales bacterium]